MCDRKSIKVNYLDLTESLQFIYRHTKEARSHTWKMDNNDTNTLTREGEDTLEKKKQYLCTL